MVYRLACDVQRRADEMLVHPRVGEVTSCV